MNNTIFHMIRRVFVFALLVTLTVSFAIPAAFAQERAYTSPIWYTPDK